MIYKDYYKDLGLSKTATATEIKKAFRVLAKKYHPDKTNGNKSAEEQFKVISEANEVLSDPVKRKKYDEFGADWKHYEDTGAQPGGFDWSKYGRGRTEQSQQSNSQESGTMFEDDGVNDLFEALFGQRSGKRRGRKNASVKGSDFQTEIILTLEEAYLGTARLIHLHGQTIKVAIKPGVEDQQQLRVTGKGGIGSNGGTNGDLYLKILISANKEYLRKGNDLHHLLPVELYTAILGGKTQIKTFKGNVTINIPKGTINGKELRLRGLGMPIYGKKNEFGDLLVKVNILLPDNLNEDEVDLFTRLASLRKGK